MKFNAITKNIGDMLENMNKNLISLFLIIAFLYIGMVVYNSFIKKRSPTLLPNKPATTTITTTTINDNESSENDLSYEKLTNDPEVLVNSPFSFSLGEDKYLPSNEFTQYNYKDLIDHNNTNENEIDIYSNDTPLFNTADRNKNELIVPKINSTQRRVNFYHM
jgi:hypothetical protein